MRTSVLANDSIDAIESMSDRHVVVETPDADQLLPLVSSATHVERNGDRIEIHGMDRAAIAQLLMENQITVLELTEVSASLEDQLIDITSDSAIYSADK